MEKLQSLLESITQEKEQLQEELDAEIARYALIILLVHTTCSLVMSPEAVRSTLLLSLKWVWSLNVV